MLPTLVLKNQFGEVSNNFVEGGSSQLWCNFIVDSTNGNGLGIRSLKSLGIANVFMHTAETPAVGNPNPAVGYGLVEFEKGYSGYLSGTFGFITPVSGTPINVTTGVTAGLAYVITSLGTTTAAQWQQLGLPANVVPEVGAAFIAPATATATGTGTIEVNLPASSGLFQISPVGNPNQTVNTSDGSGGSMVLVFLGPTSASNPTLKPVTPADGQVIGLTFVMTAQPAPVV